MLPAHLQAMSSPEDKAYEIMRELDVNYVLVIFGGLTGYASDGELNGVLYMEMAVFNLVRIHQLAFVATVHFSLLLCLLASLIGHPVDVPTCHSNLFSTPSLCYLQLLSKLGGGGGTCYRDKKG